MSTTMMTNILPHDVVVDILSRLQVKSLIRFRCVCKLWKIFFSDPSFIKMHLNHSINNYEHVMITEFRGVGFYSIAADNNNKSSLADDEVVKIDDYPFKRIKTAKYVFKILGSCNGLLLITSYEYIYCIWNPSTKEFKKLPDTPVEFPKINNKLIYRRKVWIEYGFGYDKIIEDYKVVKIVGFIDHSLEVIVYTLGSDSWRRIQVDIPETLALIYRNAAGNLLNGVLYWVAVTKLIAYSNVYELEAAHIILSFNIEDEKCEEVQLPDFIDTKFQMSVEVLGGCLCIICNFYHVYSEIWVMKEYGVKESWTKLFTITQPSVIPCFGCVRPIKFTKNGEVLFVKDNTSLVMYDPKHGTSETLQIRGLKGLFEITTYAESLISLNSGTFVGARTSGSVEKNSEESEKEEQKQGCRNGILND